VVGELIHAATQSERTHEEMAQRINHAKNCNEHTEYYRLNPKQNQDNRGDIQLDSVSNEDVIRMHKIVTHFLQKNDSQLKKLVSSLTSGEDQAAWNISKTTSPSAAPIPALLRKPSELLEIQASAMGFSVDRTTARRKLNLMATNDVDEVLYRILQADLNKVETEMLFQSIGGYVSAAAELEALGVEEPSDLHLVSSPDLGRLATLLPPAQAGRLLSLQKGSNDGARMQMAATHISRIAELEKSLNGSVTEGPILARLQKLEEVLIGKAEGGTVTQRVNRLELKLGHHDQMSRRR